MLADGGGFFANAVTRNQSWSKTMSGDINQYYNVWLNGEDKGISQEGAINAKDAAFTVIQGNYVSDAPRGVRISGGKDTIVVGNRMDEVDSRIVEQSSPASTVRIAPSWEAPF